MSADSNSVLVSIACLTFNHEKYIRDALDSFLSQEITFSIEIVVFDGGSSDANRLIINEYRLKYKDVIRCVFPDVDPGSVNSFYSLLKGCSGKYIAICEGDDYWIDPHKLQKQFDFLESHDDYGLVHTDLDVLIQEKQMFYRNVNESSALHSCFDQKTENLYEEILAGKYIIRTPTVLFRKDLFLIVISSDKYLFDNNFLMGDTPLWVELSKITKFCYLNESTAVYRRNWGSVSRQQNIEKQLRFRLSSAELRIYFYFKYGFSDSFGKWVNSYYNRSLFFYLIFVPEYRPMYHQIKLLELFRFILQNTFLSRLSAYGVRVLNCLGKI